MCVTSVASGMTTSSTASTLMRANPVAYRRGWNEIQNRRGDIKTYITPILFAGNDDRQTFLTSYYMKCKNSNKTSSYRKHMLKKYHDTVGKFYNELVEHSGKVTMEDFWQRYDYRCGDLTRVMKEIQLAKQYEQLQKKRNNKKKKASSQSPSSGDVSTCGSRSRSYFSCLNVEEETEESNPKEKKFDSPEQATQPRGGGVLEPTGTVDTVDDEHHHPDNNDGTVVDHMAKFKQGLHDTHGTPMIAEAPAMETEDDSLTDDNSNKESKNVPSIFRRTTKNLDTTSPDVEKKDKVDDVQEVVSVKESSKAGATLMMIWITCILFVFCLQTDYGNVLCGPLRPGKTLDASLLATDNNMDGKKNNISTMTFAAPWWAPESIQETAFDHFCSGRPRTILNAEVRTKKRRGGGYLNFISVTIKDSDRSNSKPLLKFNRKKSIGVDTTGEKILVEDLNGKQGIVEFGAPWALP